MDLRAPSLLLLLLVAPLAAPAGAGEVVGVAILGEPARGGAAGLRLTLPAELGASWAEAHVARLAIRRAGFQRQLEPGDLSASRTLDLPLATDGCSMVLVELGPAAAKGGPDAWRQVTRSAKVFACADRGPAHEVLRERWQAGAMAMAKVGSRIELRPLASPTLLRPGADLPVRAYFEDVDQPGAEIEAVRPDGTLLIARTDAVGVAVLRIAQSGRWVVRYRVAREGAAFVAELEMDVPAAAFWEALPAELAAPSSPAPSAPAAAGVWEELGPAPIDAQDTGRTATIAVSARKASLYYLGGASGGVWRTTNGGGDWRPLTEALPTQVIGALAVDPKKDKIVYAGTGEANIAYHSLYGVGLYKSTNRGNAWTILAEDTFAGRAFSRLLVSPDDTDQVWAAVARAGGTSSGLEGAKGHPWRKRKLGIYRSDDAGATWTYLTKKQGLPRIPASDVDFDPRDPNIVFASFGDPFGNRQNGIYRSRDGGEGFEKVTPDLAGTDVGRVTLAIAPSDPDRIYALITNPTQRGSNGGFAPGGSSTRGIYRSDDGGDTWTFRFVLNFQGQQGAYNSAVAVDPDDPDRVFFAGVEVLRSDDGAQTFTTVTPPHVDVHDLAFDANGRLLAATDGGVFRSASAGQIWESLNDRIGLVQLYPGLSVDPANPERFLAGAQDNGTNLRPGADLGWVRVFGGDGGYTAISPADPNVMFVEFQGTGNLFRSANGGASFVQSSAGVDPNDRNCFLPPMVFDPANPNRMLYATQRIYESRDQGRTWRAISGDLTGGGLAAVHALVIAPSDANVVYAATNDGRVLVSANAGTTWDLVRGNLAGWPRVTRQIAVDPTNAAEVYLADARFGGDKLLRSADRGASWTKIGGDLPDLPVNTVAVHRDGGARVLFAGLDDGVYLSTDTGATWTRYGDGLPRVPVMDLVVDAARGRLIAGTLGRGMWRINLP